jgi:hypothetical protein
VSNEKTYKALSAEQIKALEATGCSAEEWGKVKVSDRFDTSRVRNAHFYGDVSIGSVTGNVKNATGLEKPCGIYDAAIYGCTIGDNTRIANVGVHIANYDIAAGVCIENIGTMQTNAAASFGNGVEVNVLNEAGGREVILFDELTVQFAYMMCLHRYRPKLIEKLKAVAGDYVESVRSDRGKVSAGASICSTGEIIDVNVGTFATINGASSVVNGTILSSEEAPTVVGSKVIAENFIIAESSQVTGGAIIENVFVGQGCKIGKQFSAENSLFFANCEGFHGEACSVFAGPYTVTHHKSSLLIAGLFSFYNAGSGTNQSNHMYKLGPVHEGKFLRGTKTGSFSYVMWPCRVGPFSVVLGKHSATFDVADFPFSHLEAQPNGRCNMVPGLHLTTVGAVRDGDKWPNRDRRKGHVIRDLISFDVFSPYTIGMMIKARAVLKELQQNTDRNIEEVSVGGAMVKRLILRMGQKYYRTAIERYLLEKVLDRASAAIQSGITKISEAFEAGDGIYSNQWVDIGGLLMPQQRLIELEDAIENGTIGSSEAIDAQLRKIQQAYESDEWVWVKNAYKQVFDVELEDISKEQLLEIAQKFLEVKTRFFHLLDSDAGKEYSEQSHCGFGADGGEEDVERDFRAVRGIYEENSFAGEIKKSISQLVRRVEELKQKIEKL